MNSIFYKTSSFTIMSLFYLPLQINVAQQNSGYISDDSTGGNIILLVLGVAIIFIAIIVVLFLSELVRKDTKQYLPQPGKSPVQSSSPSLIPPSGSTNQGKPSDPPTETNKTNSRPNHIKLKVASLSQGYNVSLNIYNYKKKGEDKIAIYRYAKKYPAIVIADGATTYKNVEGKEVSGGGETIAQEAVDRVKTSLNYLLSEPPKETTILLDRLTDIFNEINQHLINYNTTAKIPGATTLLVAFLYRDTITNHSFWVYGYWGNGDIVIINPNRMNDNWLRETQLLNSQSSENITLTLPMHEKIHPVVGLVKYQIGDILYMASDGMADIAKYIHRQYKTTLLNFLWVQGLQDNQTESKLDLPLVINGEITKFNWMLFDDASMGIIWTGDKNDRADN